MTQRLEILLVCLLWITITSCQPASRVETGPAFDEAAEAPIEAATLPPTWTSAAIPKQVTRILSEELRSTPIVTQNPTRDPNQGMLSAGGPWILLTTREGGRIVRDLYGTTFQRFDRQGELFISPVGNTIVSMTFDKVVFTALPSLETLLEYEFTEGQIASGMLGIFYFWSPDGSYFAFLESTEGSVDTEVLRAHLYYREENRVETLETDFEIDTFVGWSPDNRFLLVRGKFPGNGDGIWSVDMRDRSIRLVDDSLSEVGQYAMGEITGWISDSTFIDWQKFNRREDEKSACDRVIRAVDLDRGVLKILAGPTAIMPAALDPASNMLFFGIVPIECDHLLEPGLYRYDFMQSRPERIESWTYLIDLVPEWPIRWSTDLGKFFVESSYPTNRTGFFSPDGELSFTIAGAFSTNPSPNGQWILVYSREGDYLIDRLGLIVSGFPAGEYGNAIWLPDSSGLFLESDRGVALLEAKTGWQPVFIPGAESVEAAIVRSPD